AACSGCLTGSCACPSGPGPPSSRCSAHRAPSPWATSPPISTPPAGRSWSGGSCGRASCAASTVGEHGPDTWPGGSGAFAEAPAGTASRQTAWLLVEQEGSWGPTALRDSRLDGEVAAEIDRGHRRPPPRGPLG